MADTKQKPTLAVGFDLPTAIRAVLPNGRLLGSDGSVWLVRKAPLQPIADAKSVNDRIEAFLPLLAAYEELAVMAPVNVTRRAVARKSYRQTHMLMVNTPKVYVPKPGSKNAAFLKEVFPREITEKRVLMLAVRLVDKIGGDGGMSAAIDSIVETLVAGNTPMSDYDTDERRVDAALARCGFSVPTQDEIHMANSWWNQGRFPDTVNLPHSDHMHIFSDTAAARMADDAGRNDCANWPHIPSHRSLTMAVLENFDFSFLSPSETFANWAVGLLADGAVAISIRGNIEPAKVTRAELRRQRKRYLDDINERFQHGKMELAEQTEMEAILTDVEDVYATKGGSPTIVDASVLIAFDGEVEDISTAGAGTSAQLRVMNLRQSQAMAEMMLCSHIRANPVLHDMPSQNIACSGIQSLSVVGDRTGALLGFTQRDRQPVLFDPKASTNEDTGPIAVHVGSTGSGKLVTQVTPIPTPSGWTAMGELKVGSKVLGRDGKPASVTHLSPIEENPDLFRITFSDGQAIDADGNHQWVVSSFNDRNMVRGGKHRAAIENWNQAKTVMDALDALAQEYPADHESTVKNLFDIVSERIDNNPWNLERAIHWSLRMMDCPYRTVTMESTQNRKRGEVVKTDPVKLLPVEESLRALIHKWTNVKGGNAARWAATTKARLAAATAALESGEFAEHLMARDIVKLMQAHGDTAKLTPDTVRTMVTAAGIKPIRGHAEVRIPISGSNPTKTVKSLYPTALAIKSLSARLGQQYGEEMTLEAHERVMSTGEILSDGLLTNLGQAKYSIRLSKPLDLPEVDLPIDPYIMGAWLGDGSTAAGVITSSPADSCTDSDGLSDRTHMLSMINEHYDSRVGSDARGQTIYVDGLADDLRATGFKLKSGIADKHIPPAYLRASYDQRLALLQGLMDTDGTIDVNGACEFVQAKLGLVEQVVELIRSLGIKTGPIASGPSHATITLPDGTKERRPGAGKHRVVFTTDLPVFRLPRKLARIQETVRETQKWLYIESIEPIDPVPARCITVDSPDSTYLVGGFIPTHNTQMLLWKAVQYDNLGIPQIFVDPKTGSDHSQTIENIGGHVTSLDELASADGIFDPIRFSSTATVGVELAVSMLSAIDPWGGDSKKFEVDLYRALSYGVNHGAQCIGEALDLAQKAKWANEALCQPIFRLAESSPTFRACVGIYPNGEALRVADGLTYIKTGGMHLELPEPGAVDTASLTQRIGMALVRMMVFGSLMALEGRGGVIHLDEAWVFLGAGKAEVQRLGRLARSQNVTAELYTQRISDALEAQLDGYISRGTILPTADETEARAALALFHIEATPDRVAAITAKATIGGADSVTPNWNSMRALRDPDTRKVLRGSIGIVSDLAGRAVPVHIKLPDVFLKLSSTTPSDIAAREKVLATVGR